MVGVLAGGCDRGPGRVAELRQQILELAPLVDATRLREADHDTANWLTHGRTYAEDRFSPLRQIHLDNIDSVGLAWTMDFGPLVKVEATPLAFEGVLFTTGEWGVVYAVDAREGTLIWRWDPAVPLRRQRFLCCGPVNRGVALYGGKVYVGTLDGRLVALDAATGTPVWTAQTTDTSRPYSIAGVPRVFEGFVVIGNGGADFGVRGYVSAYDAETGQLAWRTHTVPGNPADGFESEAMRLAAETWSGEWWKAGGGGTVWDAIVYDPELGLVFVGTGNGSPHNRHVRSPGGGDNLYLASILALRLRDGELVWHYQTTPAETWDYTATQPIVLADLEIEGERRPVLMQAPKNGFFYVLDRETGELISAAPFVEVGWAIGVDSATSRPIEAPDAFPPDQVWTVRPSMSGGHSWQSMSFSHATGLVYFPVVEGESIIVPDPTWEYDPQLRNVGTGPNAVVQWPSDLVVSPRQGFLVAWDPVGRRTEWRVPLEFPGNGGTLATAGGLVFQGTGDGRLVAYRATDRAEVWSSPVGTSVSAAPITYLVDGRQYLTLMAGSTTLRNQPHARGRPKGEARMLTFALGESRLPPQPFEEESRAPPDTRGLTQTVGADEIRRGSQLYHKYCAACHGTAVESGGAMPDLRYALPRVFDDFEEIVLAGSLVERGMPEFRAQLSLEELDLIRAFVLVRARALSR